jgi:hypothetical protein
MTVPSPKNCTLFFLVFPNFTTIFSKNKYFQIYFFLNFDFFFEKMGSTIFTLFSKMAAPPLWKKSAHVCYCHIIFNYI